MSIGKFKKLIKLAITIRVRESDLWEYGDWEKTYNLKLQLYNELHSLFLVKTFQKLKLMLQN